MDPKEVVEIMRRAAKEGAKEGAKEAVAELGKQLLDSGAGMNMFEKALAQFQPPEAPAESEEKEKA